MSSRGELFVQEDIREKFGNKLDKVFGKNNWELDAGDYYNLWDERQFPDIVEINVVNYDEELDEEIVIGKLKIVVKFSIEGDEFYGRSIEVRAGKLLSLTRV